LLWPSLPERIGWRFKAREPLIPATRHHHFSLNPSLLLLLQG